MEMCAPAMTMDYEPLLQMQHPAQAQRVLFEWTAEGLQWYPAQLDSLDRDHLALPIDVLHHYTQHRSY